jgi:DNA-binding transcriptional MocR family regulator
LVDICQRTGTRIIDDDIYGELLEGGAPRPLRAWDPEGAVVSYVTSFCKSVAPGLRVGFCIPGPEWHERFADRKCQQDLHSAVVAEVALREFLRAGAFDPHLEKLRQRNRRRREIALETIARAFPNGTEVPVPRGGYMLWAQLPGHFDLKALATAARAERVVFGADRVFFAAPPERSCLRLNCAKASEEELVQGIETLGRLLKKGG